MRRFVLVLALALAILPGVLAAQEILEKIEIVGNDRVTRETILYYLSVREGDYFSEEQVKRDFRVLWSTGFFADLKIEDLLGSRGKIIRITVEENPVSLFIEKLDKAEADTNVRAVIVRINSPGGGVTASDILHQRLRRFVA
jgi:outer membrane protein assembly factor BamA